VCFALWKAVLVERNSNQKTDWIMSSYLLRFAMYVWIGFSIYVRHKIIFLIFSLSVMLFVAFKESVAMSGFYVLFAIFMYLSGDWLNQHIAKESLDYESWVNKCLRRHCLLIVASKK
jgi:hypothetical protein